MDEPTLRFFIHLGDLAAVAWAGLALFGLVLQLLNLEREARCFGLGLVLQAPQPGHLPRQLLVLLDQRRQPLAGRGEPVRHAAQGGLLQGRQRLRRRAPAPPQEEERRDRVELEDRLAQRLERCTCGVGPAVVAEELEGQ